MVSTFFILTVIALVLSLIGVLSGNKTLANIGQGFSLAAGIYFAYCVLLAANIIVNGRV